MNASGGSVCLQLGQRAVSIWVSLGRCKENQDTVENPRARINTGVNTSTSALSSFTNTFMNSLPHIHKRKFIFFRSGFLNLSFIDIWGWIIVCGRCPVYCQIFSNIPDLDSLDVGHAIALQLWRHKMPADVAKCPQSLGRKRWQHCHWLITPP